MNEPGDRGIELLHDLSVVLARLTRIPVPGLATTADDIHPVRLLWAYPVVGTLIGAAAALAYGLASALGLPPLLAATIAVACLLALSGVRPENSFVRGAERLCGGSSTDGVAPGGPLGTVGIAALVLTLAVRIGALAALAEPAVVAGVLVAAGALSQAAAAVTRHYAPQFGDEPPPEDFPDDDDDDDATPQPRPGSGPALAAVLIGVLVAVLVLPFAVFASIAAAAVGGGAVAVLAARAGDMPGPELLRAAQHGAEIAVLVAVAAAAGD